MKNQESPSIFDLSEEGHAAYSLPSSSAAFEAYEPPAALIRKSPLPLPEVTELNLTRHFSRLAHRNVGIDNIFYPLGSCTMKLNPRINEVAASLPGFTNCHPLAPSKSVQGCLKLIYRLIERLCEICGMTSGSLCPNAGSQGEFVGIRMIDAYHRSREDFNRSEMIVPDNAHGTNPASAAMAAFSCVSVPTAENGDIDLDALKEAVSERTAGMMLTNPSTLGLFTRNIEEAAQIVHDAGGLLYYDGANLNAILNVCRPGVMGFDVVHLNLHKTFSTPHGGGGPGSGPVLCVDKLAPYLPIPRVVQNGEDYEIVKKSAKSIGQIATFHGNFGIYLRAYLYILMHGDDGLRRIAEGAVTNANYLRVHLSKLFKAPYDRLCMHEFVLQADNYLDKGVRALDVAKRLLDYGFHAPTVYFPLMIKECMLIEPTEAESRSTLDAFIEALKSIVDEIQTETDLVTSAPHHMVATRLDEVRAAKQPVICHQSIKEALSS